jgi:hypothetical protein
MKKIIALLTLGLIVYSCATVPLSGRRQLSIINNSEVLPLAYDQYGQVLKESKVLTNTKEGQQVVTVGKRIANAVDTYL